MKPDDVIESVAAEFCRVAREGINPTVYHWGSFQIGEPINFATGHKLKGFNALAANLSMVENTHFITNQWATYDQAKKLGGIVWRGQEATPVLHKTQRGYGVTYLFNLSQIGNIDYLTAYAPETGLDDLAPLLNPMPDPQLCHELIHFTAGLLNRDWPLEELTADLGAMILCQRYGVDGMDVHQGEYLSDWNSVIMDDPTALLMACGKAKAAVSYIERVRLTAF